MRKVSDMKQDITPFSVPGWDAANPANSFRMFARQVHKKAKVILMRDGNHTEMFFFLPPDGKGHIMSWRSRRRNLEEQWLRKHVDEHHAYGVVHVVEARALVAKPPAKPTHLPMEDDEIAGSERKPDQQKEALLVSAQSRDGWATSWMDEISREADGTPILVACRKFDDFHGRPGKIFA